jgi:hypothetical protein
VKEEGREAGRRGRGREEGGKGQRERERDRQTDRTPEGRKEGERNFSLKKLDRFRGMAQVVECLHSNSKALKSKPHCRWQGAEQRRRKKRNWINSPFWH